MNGIVRGAWLSLALAATSLVGCVTEPTEETDPTSDVLLGTEDLVAIPRATTVEEMVARTTKNLRSNGSGSFYLAIRRSALGERWFWSTYLEQLQPYGPSPGTLGTRVVRFREQNGKLFVFDADDRNGTSDIFSPDLIIDAFDIVDSGPFNALPGSGGFLLIDPAAGQNRFGALADGWGSGTAAVKLETELAFVEDWKAWNDGGSFAHIFAAYADQPLGTPDDIDTNDFRVAATTRVTLRRYYETPGYTPTPNPGVPHFFTADPLNFSNGSPVVNQNAVHWAFRPGMQPIKWKIGRGILQYQNDPALGGADLVGAVKRGIESWNTVFGYPVFQAELAGPNDRFGDDHNNYFIVDTDPTLGFAYADWRTNPNTSEVRGASVYFSGAFFQPFPDDATNETGAPARPAAKHKAVPRLVWQGQHAEPLCVRYADERRPSTALPGEGTQFTAKEKLENYIQEVSLHEVGHTLGLRHNFKGSLELSSVMDYNVEADAVRLDRPAPYDVAAVKFLYGLSPTAPTQAFCTDEDTLSDAQCDRFDTTANPLTNDLAPRFKQQLRDSLAERSQLTYGQIFAITRYVRGAANEQQRLEAFNALIGDVAPPLAADVTALGPNAAAWANLYNALLLENLFLAPQGYRDDIAVNPPLYDAAFRARVVEVAKNSLLGTDGNRSLDTMRTMVDVLKAMQHGDALTALASARATFAANRNSYPVATQPYIDDLIRRMDLAMSPYFY